VLARVLAIAFNTYREAVRARLLVGLFVLALATCAYSVIVAALSLHNEVRVVADLGAASLSLFGVVVAVVLGSTSLYRELELKTVFPILSRPVRRWEYVLGKYGGAMITVKVFIAIDTAAVLGFLAIEAGQSEWKVGAVALLMLLILGTLLVRAKHARDYVLIPWGLALAVAMWLVAAPAGDDRQLVLASAVLAVSEVAVVAAVATLFSSFSSPVLTATFTTLVFIIGRESDTLAHLPRKIFGNEIVAGGKVLAHIVPNLHVYVPARALLLGSVPDQPVVPYVAKAVAMAVLYATCLLVVSALAFRKRDFA
jgi:Cu-processing system permease protein